MEAVKKDEMKKFEYLTTSEKFPKEDEHLADMGSKGWELCAVIENGCINGWDYYWKRALPESNDKTETK